MTEALRDFNQKKLATIDRIRHDGRLTASTCKVGAELFSLVDFRTGDAWPSELYLAEKLCLAHRTVKMAIVALKAAGYIVVDKRGRSNRYRPIFEAVEKGQNLPLSKIEQGQILPLSDADRGKKGDEQGQKTSENRGKKGPPISLENTLRPSARGTVGSAGAPDGAGVPPSDQLDGFAARLAERLGRQTFDAWLGKVAFLSEEGDLLTLAAPTAFIASKVEGFYGGSILEVWQQERPPIVRLKVVVAKGLAAPAVSGVASLGDRRNAASADAYWLDESGIDIVSEQLRIAHDTAKATVRDWLKRCGNDAAGLRRIISDASDQRLTGDDFSNVVKQRTKSLLFADQSALPLGPVALRRSAS